MNSKEKGLSAEEMEEALEQARYYVSNLHKGLDGRCHFCRTLWPCQVFATSRALLAATREGAGEKLPRIPLPPPCDEYEACDDGCGEHCYKCQNNETRHRQWAEALAAAEERGKKAGVEMAATRACYWCGVPDAPLVKLDVPDAPYTATRVVGTGSGRTVVKYERLFHKRAGWDDVSECDASAIRALALTPTAQEKEKA